MSTGVDDTNISIAKLQYGAVITSSCESEMWGDFCK